MPAMLSHSREGLRAGKAWAAWASGRLVGVDELATLGVKPNVQRPFIDDFDFIKLKIAMREEIFLDNGGKVFFIDFYRAPTKPSSL